MIHSLYSNKEIFLRELISNASDACDKLRFEALTDKELFENDAELKIRVSFDKAARTITIADNGIGMSREEVIANIGTIAKSGTREFFKQADRRAGERCQSDRPVRRRVLFVVHRRRQGHAGHAPRRRCPPTTACAGNRDGGGEYTIETVDQSGARHRGHAASARRRG